jgi:hypothetical protein
VTRDRDWCQQGTEKLVPQYDKCLSYTGTYLEIGGHTVAQLIEALRYQPEGSRDRFPMVSLESFIDIILTAALWPLTEMSTRVISWG